MSQSPTDSDPIVSREWFLVPLFVIDEALEKIKDGSIVDSVYDPTSVKLVRIPAR